MAIEFSSAATLQMVGGTVLATITQGQTTTTLVRITEVDLKLLRLTTSTPPRGKGRGVGLLPSSSHWQAT